MSHITLFSIFVFFLLCFSPKMSLNILQISEGYNPSHVFFNHKMARSLVANGHNVTLLVFQLFLDLSNILPPDGVKQYVISADITNETLLAAQEVYDEMVFSESSNFHMTIAFVYEMATQVTSCKKVLDPHGLLRDLKLQNFDLLLTHHLDVCQFFLAHHLGIKNTVLQSAFSGTSTWIAFSMHLPMPPSYLQDVLYTQNSENLNFMERVVNFGYFVLNWLLLHLLVYLESPLYQKLGRPSTWKLMSIGEAVVVNGEKWLAFPRPLTNEILYLSDLKDFNVSGMEEETLDPYWKNVLSSGKTGTILFSLGSLANTEAMPEEMMNGMLEAFGAFADYAVVWKMDRDIPKIEKYKNLHIVKWFPQKQLLADPRVKLFITHCGYNSLLEALHAGVPIVAVPLFADQAFNAMQAVKHGLGLSVNKMTMKNSQEMVKAINTVLHDPKYSNYYVFLNMETLISGALLIFYVQHSEGT